MMFIIKLFLVSLVFYLSGPSATVHAKSSKRGLCVPPRQGFVCGDLAAFNSSVSWWYNWANKPNHEIDGWCYCGVSDCGPSPDDPEFIPMVWGYYGSITPDIEEKYPMILGFNEPNHSDQSNLSPAKAAEGWIKLQEAYPDRELVSPAPAQGGQYEWFDEFFEICDSLGCRINYVAIHDYRGNANNVMNMLETLYNRYGRKVWLTEFAKCCTRDVTQVENFMKDVIPRLEAADFVYRYSWFLTRYGELEERHSTGDWYLDKVNSLLEVDSQELTSVGRLYNELTF